MATSRNRAEGKPPKQGLDKKSSATTASTNGSNNGSASSSLDSLRKLYATLLRCRIAQQEFSSSQAMAGRYDFCIGHEAVTAGAVADLRVEDTIAASRRNLAALICRGLPIEDLLQKGGDHAPRLCAVGTLTASSLPQHPVHLGTGIALAHKLERKQNVVVALCMGEPTPSDSWHDALRAAATQKLPILYVIEEAKVPEASTSPATVTFLEDFSFYLKDYGFPCIQVDAADAVAVWRVAQESIHRARNGAGPTLIECVMKSQQDPLVRMEDYMRKRKVWDDEWKAQLVARMNVDTQMLVGVEVLSR